MRFDELLYNDEVLDALYYMHFEECTPIQEMAIPVVEEGHDLIGIAQTGTGKTAAYLLPVIDIMRDGDYPEDAINCVIMAPTRELAQQIDQQLQGFSYFMPINSLAIYGGTDGATFEQQRQGLKKGADIVIATPGRLLAHIKMGYVDLSKVSFFVLDEADRMLDMGFYDDIMAVVKELPKERQTLMFSATMPPNIRKLAQNILVNPKEVKLQVSKPAERIRQMAYICYDAAKLEILKHVLETNKFERVIIFAGSKLKVKELGLQLKRCATKTPKSGWTVGVMHSDLEQKERDEVMLGFKSGRTNILVATDIVARGIDIDDISIVINYDVPREGEEYVHRVGRTARANNDGIAITFVNEKDCRKFAMIEKFIEKTVEKCPLPKGLEGPNYDDMVQKRDVRRRRGSHGHKSHGNSKNEPRNPQPSKPNSRPQGAKHKRRRKRPDGNNA